MLKSLFLVPLFAGPMVSCAATLSYEATGQLAYVSAGSHPWAVGTPFTVRFSYDAASLQSVSMWGDFMASAMIANGEFLLNGETVIAFTGDVLWQYDAYQTFNFQTGVAYTDDAIEDGPRTVTPGDSIFTLWLGIPAGFLPDGRLYDDTIAASIPVLGHMTFDQRIAPSAIGWGDTTAIRFIPEPGVACLWISGWAVLTLLRRSRCMPRSSGPHPAM